LKFSRLKPVGETLVVSRLGGDILDRSIRGQAPFPYFLEYDRERKWA